MMTINQIQPTTQYTVGAKPWQPAE